MPCEIRTVSGKSLLLELWVSGTGGGDLSVILSLKAKSKGTLVEALTGLSPLMNGLNFHFLAAATAA